MKKKIWLAGFLAVLIAAGSGLAAGKSSAELGRELFNDAKLGGSTNEASCNSCHANGKGLENAVGKKKFSRLINTCLIDRMAGEKIDGRSVSMRSHKKYIKSLQN